MYSRGELVAAHDHFLAMSGAAQASGDWEAYCELFAEDAVYVEHFLGVSHGREEIKKWFIPAMSSWTHMTYPLKWRTFNEQDGLVAFCVGNDLPDVDGNGPYTVDSWTMLEYAGNNQWSREEDIYNPETMLTMLTKWCEAAGVPFPAPDFGTPG